MTVRRYLDLLALTYQISLVPAYTTDVGLRLVKTPKLYFTDTGLACYLSGASDWNALGRQGRLGPMLETWIANELTKWIAAQSEDFHLYFWRTHSGQEVDFLLARGEELIAIEVKAARHVEHRDLTGIEACEQALGKRIRFSLVLYGGRELVSLGPRRVAVPYATALLD